jgi:glycosyltransferase involved in cell wall biosynthesis
VRVLQLSKFYPPVYGGIESVVFELTEGMNALGLHTDVLCAHTERGTIVEQAEAGYRITRASSWGKLLSTSMSSAMLTEVGRQAPDYQVIHVHLPDPLTNLALWCHRPQAKIVVHWHSDVVNQRMALKLYEPLQSWLLGRADAIVATSAAYASSSPWLRDVQHKVHVIPIGIRDLAPAEPGVLQRIRAENAGRRIVFALGRMTPYKAFDSLIEVANRLPEDVLIVVGGSGELLEEHRHAVTAAGLDTRVRFVGRLSSDEIRAYYQISTLFCLPSAVRAEAFGVVLLEAMAAKLPVVSVDIDGSGVPWVNQHGVTGLNVPVRDSEALAGALIQLLGDRAMATAMASAGRARYEAMFRAHTMVDRTVALYRLLVP